MTEKILFNKALKGASTRRNTFPEIALQESVISDFKATRISAWFIYIYCKILLAVIAYSAFKGIYNIGIIKNYPML